MGFQTQKNIKPGNHRANSAAEASVTNSKAPLQKNVMHQHILLILACKLEEISQPNVQTPLLPGTCSLERRGILPILLPSPS